jgi:hypothetical protein
MSADAREGFRDAHTWRPRLGGACSYTYLDHRAQLVVVPARIARVRPEWVLDVDVEVGARTVRHYAVRMAVSELRPNTWRLRDAVACSASGHATAFERCPAVSRAPCSPAV